jgi:hypothetical protein
MAHDKLDSELGRPLRANDIAEWLGVDTDFVRKYYRELGGVRLGNPRRGRLLFFEKHVVDAIRRMYAQQSNETGQAEMAGLGDERRQEETKNIQHKERGSEMGGRAKKRRLVEDKYGLTGTSGMGQ